MGELKTNTIKTINGEIKLAELIVLPDSSFETVSESGIVIPKGVGKTHEEGTVVAAHDNSIFKVNDRVIYELKDRSNPDANQTVLIGELLHDVFLERHIWAHNDHPHETVFIDPHSDISVSESEIYIPSEVLGIPKEGTVVSAPINSAFQPGQKVLYRKKEGSIYATAVIDDKEVDVLPEDNIFMIDGNISPNRILVKIDTAAQKSRREDMEGGMARSQLYLQMKYNLQYGVVESIGSRAQEQYPTLKKGDTVIFHHNVESQKHRLMYKKSDVNGKIFEYRILETFGEIFAKITEKTFASITYPFIETFGDYIFLEWTFGMFAKNTTAKSNYIDTDLNLPICDNMATLKETISSTLQDIVLKYREKEEALLSRIRLLNPDIQHEKDYGDTIESEMRKSALEYKANEINIKENTLIHCKGIYPDQHHYLIPYKYPYPMDIMGKKYLITKRSLTVAYNSQNIKETIMDVNKIKANSDCLIARVIVKEQKSSIAIPENSVAPPQEAIVISCGDAITSIKKDDIVYFRIGAGRRLPIADDHVIELRNPEIFAYESN